MWHWRPCVFPAIRRAITAEGQERRPEAGMRDPQAVQGLTGLNDAASSPRHPANRQKRISRK
ncbi:hypothetical protein Pth03_06740 [Planotetraspora thailandica]|uniref:Uncharacterized protein n=1 Tax=Planotetraspora thailandica TaxID=487172 RepID=A0A8J3UX54_9ACTN|nr:hypothetical protein Pth03_06740 [Planotetraspora thailandica]